MSLIIELDEPKNVITRIISVRVLFLNCVLLAGTSCGVEITDVMDNASERLFARATAN